MRRALLAIAVLMTACVPIRAQAVVPVFKDYSPTIVGVTMNGVSCILWAHLKDFIPASQWESEVVCRNAAGVATQLQVRLAGETMQGAYPFQGASIGWIVTVTPTGLTLELGAQPAPGAGPGVQITRTF